MFQGTTQETHYTRLYSCKHFRNRVIRLQTLCAKLNLDAIVLIVGKLNLEFDDKFRYRYVPRWGNEEAAELVALWPFRLRHQWIPAVRCLQRFVRCRIEGLILSIHKLSRVQATFVDIDHFTHKLQCLHNYQGWWEWRWEGRSCQNFKVLRDGSWQKDHWYASQENWVERLCPKWSSNAWEVATHSSIWTR